MVDGRIVQSGGKELALELEEKGYDWVTRRHRRTRASPNEGNTMATENHDSRHRPERAAISPIRKRTRSTPAPA